MVSTVHLKSWLFFQKQLVKIWESNHKGHFGKNIEEAVYISKKNTKIKMYRNWMTKAISGDDKSKFHF